MSQDQRPGRMRVAVSRDTMRVPQQVAENVPAIVEHDAPATQAASSVPVMLVLLCGLIAGCLAGAAIAFLGVFGGAHP